MRKPKMRFQCYEMPRPCPWISCKHHMVWLFTGYTAPASIRADDFTWYLSRLNDDEIIRFYSKLPYSCVLDAVETQETPVTGYGEQKTLQEIANIMGRTRERVRQLQNKCLERCKLPHRLRVLQDYKNVTGRENDPYLTTFLPSFRKRMGGRVQRTYYLLDDYLLWELERDYATFKDKSKSHSEESIAIASVDLNFSP